jgi:ABC-type transport system involved in multi-copper enzyme maturation permease subunit
MGSESGGPLSPGPVFAYEWLTASRRWQGYALRSLFVLLLLAAVVVAWAERGRRLDANTLRALAKIGEVFFVAVIGTQLTLVLMAAPAATAGAICLDRARGTLAHLLVTDLSDGEIVLGKLAARLVPVFGLVGCTLPVMALLTLLGGVDPEALFGAFMVAAGVAVLGCTLALAFSLWAGKTHEALLGTYAVWGLWLLARPMVRQFNGVTGLSLPEPPRTADPYLLSFGPYWWPGQFGWTDYLVFLGAALGLSAGLAALAVLRLRPVCLRDLARKATGRWRRLFPRYAPTVVWVGNLLKRLPRLPSPPLDANPVLWREWHRNRPSRWGRMIGGLFVTLAAFFSGVAILSGAGFLAAWVNGLQVSIGLLLLAVTASTSLAEERVRGSLDVLMATPLSTREIVTGKWLGTFRLVPLLAVLPGLVVASAFLRRWDAWPGALLLVCFVICCGAAVTGLGLAMATWCSRPGRAVGLTVTLYVLVTVGWMFLVMMLVRHGPPGEGLMMASPFFWAGEFSFELCDDRAHFRTFGYAVFWTFAYAVASLALFVATLATFNRCLGRVETGLPWLHRDRLEPVKLVRVSKVVAETYEVVEEPYEVVGEPYEVV